MLITAIAGILTAHFFINVAGLHMVMKRLLNRPGRLKPFDCQQCLTVWMTLALYFLPIEISQCLATILGAGYFATLLQK
jgi:hypothetical protein